VSWRIKDICLAGRPCIFLFQILEEDLRSIESRILDCTSRPSKWEVNSISRETFRLMISCFNVLAGIRWEVPKQIYLITTDWNKLGAVKMLSSFLTATS